MLGTMKIPYHIILFTLLMPLILSAQENPVSTDTTRFLDTFSQDTIPVDTISIDTTIADTTSNKIRKNYKTSQDSLDAKVDYGAADREFMDIKNRIVHLYGDAFVKYKNIEISGDYITFDFDNNIATCTAVYDEEGNLVSKANFKEGSNEFQYDYLKYNFKTKKGFVKQGVTKEGDLFVHGMMTKFVSKDDTVQKDDIIFNKDAIITSCNLDHPHFGIRAGKLKVVPQKLAIIGPSRLEIADIPTPLWLPFGFFPIMSGKSSGIKLPSTYDLDPRWGFGIQDVGYYLPINDYLDLTVLGDIYLRGSYSIGAEMNYVKKYKYSGGTLLTFSSRNNENENGIGYNRNNSWQLRWDHRQDRKAHPYQSFNTTVDLQTSGFNRDNNVSANNILRDNITSTINYSYQFGKSPFSLSAGAQATQSLSKKTMNIRLPNAKLKMNPIFPFQRKNAIGKEQFYEKIRVDYSAEFQNTLESTDSTFYKIEELSKVETGMRQRANANANFKFLKYFSFNPSVSYDEVWFFNQENRFLQDTLVFDTASTTQVNGTDVYEIDTTFGLVQTEQIDKFLPYRKFNARAGISTKLFGTKSFKKGKLGGIRHVMTPDLAFNYTPSNEMRFIDTLDRDLRNNVYDPLGYSIIPDGVFNASPTGKQLNISSRINNNIEIKWKRRDSTIQKINLTTFNYGMSYNFAKDSFRLSDFNLTGNSSFFRGKTTISYGITLSPYAYDQEGRVDQYFWQDEQTTRPIVTNLFLRNQIRLTFKELRNMLSGTSQEEEEPSAGEARQEKNKSKTTLGQMSFLELFDLMAIRYVINFGYRENGRTVQKGIDQHSVGINGRIPITDNWNIEIGNIGYDFKNNGLLYPDLGFSRDLHCWTMRFSWQPRASSIGGAYQFFIGVNSSSLDFIKYNYNQGNNFSSF